MQRGECLQLQEFAVAVTFARAAEVAVCSTRLVGGLLDEQGAVQPVRQPAARVGETHLEGRLRFGLQEDKTVAQGHMGGGNIGVRPEGQGPVGQQAGAGAVLRQDSGAAHAHLGDGPGSALHPLGTPVGEAVGEGEFRLRSGQADEHGFLEPGLRLDRLADQQFVPFPGDVHRLVIQGIRADGVLGSYPQPVTAVEAVSLSIRARDGEIGEFGQQVGSPVYLQGEDARPETAGKIDFQLIYSISDKKYFKIGKGLQHRENEKERQYVGMKKGALEIARNLLLLLVALVVIGFVIAFFKHDLAHWHKYFFGIALWLLIGAAMFIVATVAILAIKGAMLALKIALNRVTKGKIQYLAREEEEFREKREMYKRLESKDKEVREWIWKNYTLTKKKSFVERIASSDSPDWWEGKLNGRFIAFHDPDNPYHFEIFVGKIDKEPSVNLKRIYPSNPEPKKDFEQRLDRFVGEEGRELAKNFLLYTNAPAPDYPQLRIPQLRDALLKLSSSVYFVSIYNKGVEIRVGKQQATPETIKVDVQLALSVVTTLESTPIS